MGLISMNPEELIESDEKTKEYRIMDITEGFNEETCLLQGVSWPFNSNSSDET